VSRLVSAAVATTSLMALGACGGDDGDRADRADLGADARRGAELADDNGCSACHRSGAVGPSWEGLYGSDVELEDGSVVVADEDYLTRAITDPGADISAGFNVSMPDNDLDDEEVAALVAYIRELGERS
jgi:cytochrome c oxidase subunit 2